MAHVGRAARPVAPHDRPVHLRSGRAAGCSSDTGVNSFANFPVDQAKQFIAVNHEGYLIGDAILFHLDEDVVRPRRLVHGARLGAVHRRDRRLRRHVRARRQLAHARARRDPKLYRYELQGPNALALMEKLTGAPVPPTKFFDMATFTIDGLEVRSLRHGMAGQPGFELFGPWAEGERVRAAIVAAGEEFDLVLVGAKAYSSANLESAWVPSPLPAIFTGEGTARVPASGCPRPAPARSRAASPRTNIEDYYLTPYDLGYGRSVAFDHDFIGRAALERHAAGPLRTKVTLVWNPEDVAAAQRSLYEPGIAGEVHRLPEGALRRVPGRPRARATARMSASRTTSATSPSEHAFVSLASIDDGARRAGHRGRRSCGARSRTRTKPAVEPHRQVDDPRHGVARAVLVVRARELPQELTAASRETGLHGERDARLAAPIRLAESGRADPRRCGRGQATSRRAPITLAGARGRRLGGIRVAGDDRVDDRHVLEHRDLRALGARRELELMAHALRVQTSEDRRRRWRGG